MILFVLYYLGSCTIWCSHCWCHFTRVAWRSAALTLFRVALCTLTRVANVLQLYHFTCQMCFWLKYLHSTISWSYLYCITLEVAPSDVVTVDVTLRELLDDRWRLGLECDRRCLCLRSSLVASVILNTQMLWASKNISNIRQGKYFIRKIPCLFSGDGWPVADCCFSTSFATSWYGKSRFPSPYNCKYCRMHMNCSTMFQRYSRCIESHSSLFSLLEFHQFHHHININKNKHKLSCITN